MAQAIGLYTKKCIFRWMVGSMMFHAKGGWAEHTIITSRILSVVAICTQSGLSPGLQYTTVSHPCPPRRRVILCVLLDHFFKCCNEIEKVLRGFGILGSSGQTYDANASAWKMIETDVVIFSTLLNTLTHFCLTIVVCVTSGVHRAKKFKK